MEIGLTLSKKKILLKAKDETYIAVRGMSGEMNEETRYNLEAGGDASHERKLLGSLSVALSELKSSLPKYDITDTLVGDADEFNVCFNVSDRFRAGRVEDLKRLTEEYISEKIVADWWKASYPNYSGNYYTIVGQLIESIKKCFVLSNPYESIAHGRYKFYCKGDVRTVILYKDEITNEIDLETLKMSKFKGEGETPNLYLQTDEVDDRTLITRYIDRYVKRCGERIQAYLISCIPGFSDNELGRQKEYVFNMRFPRSWDDELLGQLAEEMHCYVVNYSLYEFIKASFPKEAEIYRMQADEAYGNIKHCVTVRKNGAIRKPLQPF